MTSASVMQPRILIIYTGGTIGMIDDPLTGTLHPFNFDHLMENVPKVKMLRYDIDNLQFAPPIDSSDILPAHWEQMARAVADNYDRYDGFVVLHGTDTMAYTASALSFMLQGLQKPVIITGSQLPIGEVRTDGEENLITALQISARRDRDGLPMVREVAILFESYLWRGNRATKMSADNFNAFRSFNCQPLARIGIDIHFFREALLRPNPASPFRPRYELNSGVMVIDLNPALGEAQLEHLLTTPGVRGIVLRTYGAGNGPTAPWFADALRRAISRGLVVVNVTQCVNGGVDPGRYATGAALAAAGVVSGYDLTVEAALTKLMHLLGTLSSPHEVKRLMAEALCGELTRS